MGVRRKQSTRKLTAAAMCVAISVVLLTLGSFVEVLDISMAVIASLAVVFGVIELGGKYPYLIYAATAILSLVLPLANKTPALLYTCFAGFYPILKNVFEGHFSRMIAWVLKTAVFLVGAALDIFLMLKFFFVGELSYQNWYPVLILPLIAIFVLYDVALTRLITAYMLRWRGRLRLRFDE